MVITAVMAYRQRGIVRAFERAAATAPATACQPGQLGLKPGLAWHQLVAQAVLRCPGEGRYFLDAANWRRLCVRRRRITAVVIVGALLLLGLLLALRAG